MECVLIYRRVPCDVIKEMDAVLSRARAHVQAARNRDCTSWHSDNVSQGHPCLSIRRHCVVGPRHHTSPQPFIAGGKPEATLPYLLVVDNRSHGGRVWRLGSPVRCYRVVGG